MSEIHICRTCCRLISDQQFVNFNETPLKTNLPQMLKDCIPELQFKVVDPCLCIKCLSLLYLFHEFKQTCLETEKKIKNYVQSHRETEFVSLKDIFVEQIPIKKEVTETTTKDIKSEDVKPNLETLLTQDIKPLKVIETPAIDIKSETDTEFEDTATIDDNIEENKDIEEVVAEIKQEVVDLTECDEETVEETPKQPSKVVKVPPNSILPKNPGYSPCGFCGSFIALNKYLGHVIACGATSGYVVVCNTTESNQQPSVKKRKINQDAVRKKIQCKVCYKKFHTQNEMEFHIKCSHTTQFKCNFNTNT